MEGWDDGPNVHSTADRETSPNTEVSPQQEPDCVCRGNWRLILKEVKPFLGKWFREESTGHEYVFYGLVHGDDDYYYGMWRQGDARLLSCVGSIEGWGFTLVQSTEKEPEAMPIEVGVE